MLHLEPTLRFPQNLVDNTIIVIETTHRTSAPSRFMVQKFAGLARDTNQYQAEGTALYCDMRINSVVTKLREP